uniref:Uncharacterized protein n=1 Tax=Picea sitchensis TaxID=3332 RepID=A9NKP4_PICSI|nr:unknown [Picea sitchensis]
MSTTRTSQLILCVNTFWKLWRKNNMAGFGLVPMEKKNVTIDMLCLLVMY